MSCKQYHSLRLYRNILLLHLGIEVMIDRQTDITVNMGVFKFLIEDIYEGSNIDPAFRVSHDDY